MIVLGSVPHHFPLHVMSAERRLGCHLRQAVQRNGSAERADRTTTAGERGEALITTFADGPTRSRHERGTGVRGGLFGPHRCPRMFSRGCPTGILNVPLQRR